MAYKPEGVTTGLNKTQRSNGSGKVSSADELVIIDGYDLNRAVILAHRDDPENPRKFEAYVKKEEVLNADAAIAKKGGADTYGWMGHKIDAKMEKKFPPRNKIILSRAVQVGYNKETDTAILEVYRVNSVNVPNKTFRAFLTMSYRVKDGVERLSRIQRWRKNGINVNDKEKINVLMKEIDEAAAYYGQKVGDVSVTVPSIGFQFRTLMKTNEVYQYAKDEASNTVWEAVDFSVPFDWIRGGATETPSPNQANGHLVTGAECLNHLEGYVNYINNHEGFKENLDNIKIEICAYDVFLASAQDNMQLTFNTDADKHKDKNPLYQLAHRKSFIDLEQTEMLEGRNAAVHGILQITDDKPIRIDNKWENVPNNWATRIHANNFRGHIHSFVRTAEGEKVKVHPSLNLLKNDTPEGMAPAAPAASSSAAPSAQEPETDFTPSFGADDNVFDDVFSNSDTNFFKD